MSKTKVLIILYLILANVNANGQNFLYSPDKQIAVEVILKEKVYYRVSFKNQVVMDASPLAMQIGNYSPGIKPHLLSKKNEEINEIINPLWGSKNKIIDHYNQLILNFKDDYSIEFRAYNNGIAYRFITRFKEKEVLVRNEEVNYRFGFETSAWILDGQSYESNFRKVALGSEITSLPENKMDKVFLPAMIETNSGVKMLITEAGLYDYPALFLKRSNDYENYLNGVFEKYALTTARGGFSNYSRLVENEADYIAKTFGTRSYPWRLMVISDNDAVFADCDLVYQLSKPTALSNTDWIKPGKVAWDWWHDYVLEGEDFVGGVNTKTYLYQIDFAAEYQLEYILVDWMWTDKYDLTLFNPEVDIEEIIQYGKEKGVGVILWCPGHTLHEQLEQALDLFSGLGAAGIKADFFGHEDQTGIRMYEDIAKEAAKRKLLVDFHGCTKPTGLSRTYPNVVNYEAVLGNEYNKISEDNLCSIQHKVTLPFTRGMIGPMDYTPGGMRNRIDQYARFYTLPVVQGTRSGEMALFVIYDEPLKMLCDAPSVYREEPDITRFIAEIPTVWDETMVLDAAFGEFVVKARKKEDIWYIAGLNGMKPLEYHLDLSFLGSGKYKAVLLKDGANSHRIGTDYLLETITIEPQSALPLRMQKGGGFIIKIETTN
jgi:alpha-glucosidase